VLFRFDPFEQFERLDRRAAMLAMDAVRTEDKVYVYFDAPGIEPDDVDLTVEKNAVTVEATRRWYDTDSQTLTSERPQGAFKRQIQFGEHVDVEAISASLDKGVLTLTVPVKEGSKPRSIEIDTSSSSGKKQLETSS
jgi:HSP20 family protein